MSRLLCCLLFILLVIPLLVAYLVCAILASIFGRTDSCKPILDLLNKLAACCSGKK